MSAVQKSINGISRNNKELSKSFNTNFMLMSEVVTAYQLRTEKLLNDVPYLMQANADEHFEEGTNVLSVASNLYQIALPKKEEL